MVKQTKPELGVNPIPQVYIVEKADVARRIQGFPFIFQEF